MPIENPPITNRDAAEKNKAATAIHLQEQFKAGQPPKDASTLGKLGAAFTAEKGAADVAAIGAEAADVVQGTETEFQTGQIEQAEQNIQDEEQLATSIQDQKNQLVQMDIGITEDEFADDILIKKLNEQQTFTDESQLMDLARDAFDSDEEFASFQQGVLQDLEKQAAEDKWEYDVYSTAQQDEAMWSEISKNAEMKEQIRVAQQQAEVKMKKSAAAAAKQGKMIGAAKVVAGAAIAYVPGGQSAGVGMATQGAQEATA